MPLNLSDSDLAFLKSQGIDPNDVVSVGGAPSMGAGRAALSTLKAHAGGTLGGGAGVLGGTALASWLLGPEVGLPATIVAGALGGLGGGYAGQKLQEAVEPTATYQEQQQEAAQAAQEHPYVSLGTDIASSALASGGAFSPMTAVKAGRAALRPLIGSALSDADKVAMAQMGEEALSPQGRQVIAKELAENNALANVGIQSTINPAINAGLSYATTGQLPSARDTIASALGGALFAKPSALGRLINRPSVAEPTEEPNANGVPKIRAFPTSGMGAEYLNTGPAEEQNQRYQDWLKAKEELAEQETEEAQPYSDLEGPNRATEMAQGGHTQTTTEKPVSQNTLRLMASKLLPSNIGRPEERPEVQNEGLTLQQLNELKQAQDLAKPAQGRTAEEELQDKMEGASGAKFAQPRIRQDYSPEDLQRYQQLEQQFRGFMQKNDLQNPEFQKVFQQFETLRNKYGGMPPKQLATPGIQGSEALGYSHEQLPEPIVQHIWSGKATTGSVMKMIAETNHPFSPLARSLLQTMDRKSAAVPWDASLRRRSSYYPTGSEHTPDTVAMAMIDTHHAPTVMEEALHSATSDKLPQEWNGLRGAELHKAMTDYLANPKGNESVKELVKCYIQAAQKMEIHGLLFGQQVTPEARTYIKAKGKFNPESYARGFAGDADEASEVSRAIPYAMGDLHEFIAHAFMDRDFQHTLNEMHSGIGNKTMWQRFVDAVRSLLGIPVSQHSMLDRVLRNSAELISQERPDIEHNQGNYERIHHEDGNFEVIYKPTGKTLYKGKSWEESQRIIESGAKNAIQKQSTSSILQHSQEGIRSQGSERGRMEQGNEREETTRTSNVERGKETTGTDVKLNTYHLGKIGETTRSMINKISDIPHPMAQKVADAFHNVLNERQKLIGRWKNSIIKASEDDKLTTADKATIAKQFQQNRLTGKYGTELLTNSRQKAFYDKALQAMGDNFKYRFENEEPVLRGNNPTMPKQVPGYWPTMPNQKIAQVYRTGTNLEEIAKLDKEFLANREKFGENPEEAQEALKDFKQSMQGGIRNTQVSNQQFFNASRRAHGIPLPESFTEQDPVRNLERYFSRQALDNAHYKFVEKNPEVMSALGEKRDAWGHEIPEDPQGSIASHPAVRHQLQEFHGEIGSPAEYNERAISSVATTLFIASPALESHKIISNVVGLTADVDNPYQFVRVLGHAVNNIKQGYQHAIEGGVTRLTARSALDMVSGQATMAERMQALAKGIRNIASLGDLTNRWGSGLLQASYETIVPSKIQRANAGNKLAQQWLRNLDPNYRVGKQYSLEEQRQLASVATNYVHGTADGRMLPAWMLNDSEVSGFFTLAHWSVAQTNRFYSNILTPAMGGEVGPLLNSLFGMAIGGYLVKEVRQYFQGRKNPIPSLAELAASDRGLEGNMGLIGYNLIAAAQYSGFGGLLSQIAKYPFDMAYKQTPYGSAFPLDQVATDLAKTLANAGTAIATDPNLNWLSLAEAVSAHLTTQTFQLGRQAMNHAINNGLITGLPAERKLLADKMAELKRFDMAEGLFYNQPDYGSNPYMNLEQKRFKYEQDPQEAIKQLPQLVNNIIETYQQNPDLMLSKLKALKQNVYATFPSMETMPLSFMKYIGFLQRYEGPEQANAALQDYMRHKVINEAKSSLIP